MPTPLFVTTPSAVTAKQELFLVDKESILSPLLPHLRQLFHVFLIARNPYGATSEDRFFPYQRQLPRLPKNTPVFILAVLLTEKEAKKTLPALLKKAKSQNTTLLIVSDRTALLPAMRKKILSLPSSHLLFFGDLYGTESFVSPVAVILKEANQTKKVTLHQMGLSTLYPIARQNLATSVLEVLLGNSSERVFFAAQKPRSALSLVRFLQKVDPLLTVDFQEKKKKEIRNTPPRDAVNLYPSPEKEEEALRDAIDKPPTSKEEFTPANSSRSKLAPRSSRLLFGMVFLFFLPLFLSVASYIVGFVSIGIAVVALNRDQTIVCEKTAGVARGAFTLAEPSERLITGLLDVAGISVKETAISRFLESGIVTANLLVSVAEAEGEIAGGLQGDLSASSDRLQVSLKKAVFALQNLQAQGSIPSLYKEKLKQEEQEISFLTTLLEGAPTLLGYNGVKEYAVLLQNNMELRPGGGFIGSVGFLTFDKGKLKKADVVPVNDLDGLLKGHIEPPFAIKKYLGAAHAYLRDSNGSLDSQENATSAARFLQLEGKSVDGVASIDFTFMRQLLTLTGPIPLPEFHSTITRENMFREISLHDINEQTSKEFLLTFEKKLLLMLKGKSVSPRLFLSLLTKAAREKHVLAASFDNSVEPLLARDNLISSPAQIQTNDLLGVFEENVAANNANYFLKRRITQSVNMARDKSASESVTLVYTNASPDDTFGGDYRSFVQLLLPQGATLLGIEINGVKQGIFPAVTDPAVYEKATYKDPQGLEVLSESRFGKTLIGFLLTVKKGEERTLIITYSVPNALPNLKEYSLSYFKQPGIELDDYTLEVLPPLGYSIHDLPVGAQKTKHGAMISQDILEDRTLRFTLRNE